jgi:glycine hydroxymethyltransferase
MKNMVAMVDRLKEHGVRIVSEGTDNHLVLCDLRPFGVDGSRVERVLELAHIACNKNTVPGDKSALVPGGLRLGTPALTTRGFTEEDFVKVADYIKKGIDISVEISKEVEGKKFGDFKKVLESKEFPAIAALKKEVETLAEEFPTIGFDKAEGKYTK